ncbi:MAG: hypothetical protein ACP5JP_04165 [bacterium]
MKKILFIVICLLLPSIAWADQESFSDFFTMNLIWSIINFIILVAGFVYLYKRFHGEKIFKTRKDNIEKLIAEAMDVKQKAITRHNEITKQLNEFDKTRQAIIDDINTRAEKEKQQILQEGEEMVARVKKEGDRIVEAEVQKAKEMINDHLQMQLYELTKEYIEKSMDIESQKNVTDNFIRKLK